MSRANIAIALLFGAAFILYWQVQSKTDSQKLSYTMSQGPDYMAEDVSSTEYNQQGVISSQVSASQMEYFEPSNTTHFTQPVYLIYPDHGQGKWRLQADKGTLNKNTGMVTLSDQVMIDALSPDQPLKSIKTNFLALDLNTMIITSDEAIYITGVDFAIEGKGLYADLNAKTVQLTSQVTGTYESK